MVFFLLFRTRRSDRAHYYSQISATNKPDHFLFYTQGKKEGIQPPSNSWNSQMCLHFSFVSKNQLQKHPAQINLNLTLAIVLVAERSKRELVGGGNLKIDDEVFFSAVNELFEAIHLVHNLAWTFRERYGWEMIWEKTGIHKKFHYKLITCCLDYWCYFLSQPDDDHRHISES